MTMSNVRARGLREERVYALNPLPAGLTKRELAKRAGLPSFPQASAEDPFHVAWQYGTGLESEMLDFAPGDPGDAMERFWELRESEARDFLREKEELGLIVVKDPADLREVIEKSLAGLTKAFEHYDQAGRQQLNELQLKHGWNEAQVAQNRALTWPNLLNEQAALAIQAHIAKLEQLLVELPDEEEPAPRRRGNRSADSASA